MGIAIIPRHRAETPRTAVWADLRRHVAHLLAGRDLYADDELLRPSAAKDARDDATWSNRQPAPRAVRRTASASAG